MEEDTEELIRRLQKDVDKYRAEAKHMGKSVRHAWDMVGVANERLRKVGLPEVVSPREAA